jgi:hypothetical protein
MLLSRHQNVSQNRGIKIANTWFENVPEFKYLGTTGKNQNWIKNVKTIICKTVILTVVLYGCENLSLKLREYLTALQNV